MQIGLLTRSEDGGRFQTGFGQEPLRERGQGAVRQIEFDPLDSVHGEEYDSGSERLTVSDHNGEILERSQLDSAQAQAFWSEGENHSPEFFAGIVEGCDYQRSGSKRLTANRSGCVLLHGKIVAGSDVLCKCRINAIATQGWSAHRTSVC